MVGSFRPGRATSGRIPHAAGLDRTPAPMSSTRCSQRCRCPRLSHTASTSGRALATTTYELARKIAAICDAPEPTVVPKFRDDDVRAASRNIESAERTLHWRAK